MAQIPTLSPISPRSVSLISVLYSFAWPNWQGIDQHVLQKVSNFCWNNDSFYDLTWPDLHRVSVMLFLKLHKHLNSCSSTKKVSAPEISCSSPVQLLFLTVDVKHCDIYEPSLLWCNNKESVFTPDSGDEDKREVNTEVQFRYHPITWNFVYTQNKITIYQHGHQLNHKAELCELTSYWQCSENRV